MINKRGKKASVIILIFCFCFLFGIIVSAYDYSIWLSDGFMTIPAPVRMYTYFANESKYAIGSAAETWTDGYGTEFIYVMTSEHNDNTYPNHNEYNDITKGYYGTAYVAETQLVHYNYPITSSEETDINFNVSYPFADASINPNVFDVQTVILHEFGHLLGLDHSSGTTPVMYGYTSVGLVKRSLTADDSYGLSQIY
jgi:hypothetical protein